MRQYDVLWIEAKNEGQAGAALRVQARSFTDTSTRRGPTPNQEYARDAVVKDAHTVIDKCGGEGAVLSS
jgi:hypothetical protein